MNVEWMDRWKNRWMERNEQNDDGVLWWREFEFIYIVSHADENLLCCCEWANVGGVGRTTIVGYWVDGKMFWFYCMRCDRGCCRGWRAIECGVGLSPPINVKMQGILKTIKTNIIIVNGRMSNQMRSKISNQTKPVKCVCVRFCMHILCSEKPTNSSLQTCEKKPQTLTKIHSISVWIERIIF